MIGTVLGQYRITGQIGRGGMGVVYAAEHTLLYRPAAVKVLLPEFSQNQDIVTRFFNEARAATTIRHPGIIEIYDFGFHVDRSAYIVMEYLQGESLAMRMTRGRMSPMSVLSIIRQLAGALGAAHAKGIVHRDLKPDNVFLVADPEVPGGERIKLLDFGIAKLAAEQGQNQTRAGAVMGTPAYMAPEQCRGVAIDHRADLYSLGCILFELCAGVPPFVGEGAGDVLAAHIYVAPPQMRAWAPDLPEELEQLVQRLLAKDPGQRMQSAGELIHHIDAINGRVYGIASISSPSHTPARTQPTAPPTPTTLSGASRSTNVPAERSSRAGVFIGIGAVLSVAVVIAIVMSRGDHGDGSSTTNTKLAEPMPAAPVAVAAQPATPTPTPAVVAPTPTPTPTAPPAVPPAPVKSATVNVTVGSAPVGADVLIDNAIVGKTPYHGTLPRSEVAVTLIVRMTGYADSTVIFHANRTFDETLQLEKKHEHVQHVAPRPVNRDESVNPFGN